MKKLLFAIFIFMFVSIIGCEVPYTGPLLSVNDVTQFLRSKGEDTVCVQDGFDSVCLKVVVREVERQGETTPAPIIHIHPTGVMYEFYYEGHLVLRGERSMDTTEIAGALVAAGIAELPADSALLGGDNGVDVDNAFEGWRIRTIQRRSQKSLVETHWKPVGLKSESWKERGCFQTLKNILR